MLACDVVMVISHAKKATSSKSIIAVLINYLAYFSHVGTLGKVILINVGNVIAEYRLGGPLNFQNVSL